MKSQLSQDIRTALDQDNFSEALQKTQQLISMDPADFDAYLLNGDIFLRMGNGAKAVENYEKAVSIRPHEAEAFFKLGNAYDHQEDIQKSLNQYQSARRLEPGNNLYMACVGRQLNKKGIESKNINLENEGLALMEQAYQAGVREENLNEQLSIAHLYQATNSWLEHPEKENFSVPTEKVHLEHAKIHLEWVRNLYDRSNQAIGKPLTELDELVRDMEKRYFAGYPYLRKVPFISGAVFFVFGFKILAIPTLLMGVAYHFSQFQPRYMANRQLFKGSYREPFIVRRLDQMNETLSGITIWSSSLSNLFFNKFLFALVFGTIRFGMVLMMLPYEIVKGFLNNYGLKQQLVEKVKSSAAQLSAVKN